MNKLIFELIQAQNGNRGLLWTEEDKQEFALLVAAAEREACAKVCEETTAAWTQVAYNRACMDCATAIRNRAEGEPK